MNRIRKIILLMTVTISVMSINPARANAAWVKDNTGWWYADGLSWITGWRLIDGKWYYFNSNGYMAHDTTVEGYVLGSDGAWQEKQNNTTKVTPSEEFEFNKLTGTITKYKGSDTEVIIPNEINGTKVISIAGEAFDNLCQAKTVIIPNGVISIESGAFYGCRNLANIQIPSSMTKITGDSFLECSKLSEINIDYNNSNYINVDGVIYDKEKTKLIRYAPGKSYVESYKIPETVSEIESNAFERANIGSIEIPKGVTKINSGTFNASMLRSIKIPDNLVSIGNYAFSFCWELSEIKIPSTVTSIGEGAFWHCEKLANIKIPYGITTIENKTFYECASLVDVEIPQSVVTIGDYAFSKCTSLNKPNIPSSVKTIGRYAFEKNNLDDVICID